MSVTYTYQGAVSPETLTLTISGTAAGLDMTTVSAATSYATSPSGSTRTWSLSLSGATSSQVTATHTFAAGDVDELGDYELLVYLTTPGGTRRVGPVTLEVREY